MNTSIATHFPQDCPVLPPAIAALIARWDVSRPAADLIAAINEQSEQQFADATPINAAKTGKKRGKCMTRRAGQDGSQPYKEGKNWKTRIWIDVPGQEKRTHPGVIICPIKGPQSLNLCQRKARVRELIAETGVNDTKRFEDAVKPQGTITFSQQAKIMLEEMRTRNRKPVAKGSLENYERSFRLHLNPILGDMPVSQIYNPELNQVVRALTNKQMSANSMTGHITIAKSVVASALDKRTGEALYPRAWNVKLIDLPIIDQDKMNTPCFSRELLTEIIAYYDEPQLRTLYIALAASGLRIAEMLGIEIDKHLSADFQTMSIRQQADGLHISDRLKTSASKREVDLHPDIAAAIKAFVADRQSGFLFQTRNRNPLTVTLARNKLQDALKALGYVNEHTGTYLAGLHAFRRSRDTYLRNGTSCPDGVCKFWMGHSFGKDMSEHYDKVKRDLKFRRFMAESCGYGFDLPPVVPAVPAIHADEEAA